MKILIISEYFPQTVQKDIGHSSYSWQISYMYNNIEASASQHSFSLHCIFNNCQHWMFQTQYWNPYNIVLLWNTVPTLIGSHIFISLSSPNWTCFTMVPFKSVGSLVAWGIIRGGTDYSPLPWNIKSIELWIFTSLSHITEVIRKKKETKIEQFLALPSEDTHQIE